MEPRWEILTSDMSEVTKRMKVPGGWVILNRYRYSGGFAQTMHFVADEKFEWSIKQK